MLHVKFLEFHKVTDSKKLRRWGGDHRQNFLLMYERLHLIIYLLFSVQTYEVNAFEDTYHFKRTEV